MSGTLFTRRAALGATAAAVAAVARASSIAAQSTPTAGPASAGTPASGTQPDGTWVFTDDLGTKITLKSAPKRIVAEIAAAAALWDFGVRPVAFWGLGANETPTETVIGRMDLDQIEDLGPGFDSFDIEKLISVNPDLIITTAYSSYASKYWQLNPDSVDTVKQVAPLLGVLVTDASEDEVIGRVERVATAITATQAPPDLVAARSGYDAASQAVKDAIAAKPGMIVEAVSGTTDSLYVGNQNVSSDLRLFADLGVTQPKTDDTTNSFLQLSWENANQYPADVFLIDNRPTAMTLDQMKTYGSFASLPAIQAGQTGDWNVAYVHSYQGLTLILNELAGVIGKYRADIVP